MKKILPILIILIHCVINADSIKDSLEMRLNIDPVFSLTIETKMEPFVKTYSANELLKPSTNQIIKDKDLGGIIDLGSLIARKRGKEILPLISEYRVKMIVHCQTNLGNPYIITQTLESPLKGEQTAELFPEKALVYIAAIDPELGNTENGKIHKQWESPLLPHDTETIYTSSNNRGEYLGNVLNIWYWISDQQDDKVTVSQRSDTYSSTVTITMIEL